MSALSIPLSVQAQAIKSACSKYSVPLQVFIGMYELETSLGTNVTVSTAGAIGPFQFEPGTAGQYGYPLTNTPSVTQFQQQADAAAHLLADNYKQFHDWHSALAAYNAGPGNIGAGSGYATSALAFAIPGDWAAALGAAPGSAVAGGTAGLGGSGTAANAAPANTYKFQVGGTDNPDEDYWTAANRLAQEVNWYLFSDAETVYYIDGADLIAQDPGKNAYIDSVKHLDRIVNLEVTFDNTAFQYVSTHKHKTAKIQRKAALAKVTSPTEAHLDLICGIDEFRAGDLIVLSSCGPADGRWIIADCTRSVFAVFSSLTLVPPIAPLAEQAAAGTSGPSAASAVTGKTTGGTGTSAQWQTFPTTIAADRLLGHQQPNLRVAQVANCILAQFSGLHINSTWRAGTDAGACSHANGNAVDIGDGTNGSALMDEAGRWVNANLKSALCQGIHQGIHGEAILSCNAGSDVPAPGFWGVGTWNEHVNHIHVSMTP